jgi:hypothetical protein
MVAALLHTAPVGVPIDVEGQAAERQWGVVAVVEPDRSTDAGALVALVVRGDRGRGGGREKLLRTGGVLCAWRGAAAQSWQRGSEETRRKEASEAGELRVRHLRLPVPALLDGPTAICGSGVRDFRKNRREGRARGGRRSGVTATVQPFSQE